MFCKDLTVLQFFIVEDDILHDLMIYFLLTEPL